MDARHIKLRGGLPRFAGKLLRGEAAAVAYLGGSITEGAGASVQDETSWRALTGQALAARYAASRFSFINAGVGGTTSTFGAHRLRAHALSQGQGQGRGGIDLLFVEFAVNDGADREESIRGMEGIVRQCRRLSPHTELCFLYTAADKNLASDAMPFNIAVHEEVAAHYGIASLNLAGGVQDWVAAGKTTWEALAPDRVHPNDEGHALYASDVNAFLDQAVREANMAVRTADMAASSGVSAASEAQPGDEAVRLPLPLDERSYEDGDMLDFDGAACSGQVRIRELGAADPLMNWRFGTRHLLIEAGEGDAVTFAVEGHRAGIVLLHGPDSGILEYSLDGGANFAQADVFDEWCLLAYRPIPVVFPFQAGRGQQVTIRCAGTKDERSKGTSIRILKLLSS